MIKVEKSQSQTINPSGSTRITEFPMDDPDINGAIAEIDGRYPNAGFAKNLESKELVYVLSGSGTIILTDKSITFRHGDVLLIDKEELFAWKGKFSIFMVTSPKFNPDQHIIVNASIKSDQS